VKKVLIAFAALLALAGGAVYLAYHSIDVIVKMALEHYGPDVLGAKVDVLDVRISARDGKGSVKRLEIGNPAGFSAARAARFGEIRVSLDPLTITDDVVYVNEIVVDSPSITYERSGKGTNLEAIQKNIERYVASRTSGDSRARPGERKAVKRFVIGRLTIRGAKVTMTNPALKGQGITFDLPDIQLRELGRKQGGLRASEIANIVANTLLQRIAQRILTNVDLLRRGGLEGAVDALKGLLK
jgi:uncharacterized protein involved in outer membrane biogenesis